MRTYPNLDSESECEEVERLAAPQWMLDQLRLNPSYVFWGPHEDSMGFPSGKGWNSPMFLNSWSEHWSLDELNELVNFYFSIERDSHDCGTCAGRGFHPDAQWITESWYTTDSPFTSPTVSEQQAKDLLARFGCEFKAGIHGRQNLPDEATLTRYGKAFLEHCVSTIENGGEWCTDITQDEVDVLWENDRLKADFKTKPTAEQVNDAAKHSRGFIHDAINAYYCKKQRAKRLGVPFLCDTCGGHGQIYEGEAYLVLTLWMLHPRKGASRGVEIKHIQQDELDSVYAYLREAAERNRARFIKVPNPILSVA